VAANLSHAVHFPSSDLYPSLVANGSYAIDTRKQPWCFVLPRTAAEVSEALTALRSAGNGAGDWHVAVRSGGHGGDAQNNIADGVTIDLTRLNTTTYDEATNVASVGTGARWGNVYRELEKHGVVVTGGREAVVGVGGLVLGGGISWYTARTGFACDNVVNFEVVLASGDIINANASANSDLWLALKGGSSNFGIVTRFDLEATPANNLFIERRSIDMEYSNEVIDAVSGFTNLDQSFNDNALISIVTYDPDTEKSVISVTEVNTMDRANSSAFGALNRIPTLAPATTESISLATSANRTQLSGQYR
jgi:FAD/FMN-containing dehydrogenase